MLYMTRKLKSGLKNILIQPQQLNIVNNVDWATDLVLTINVRMMRLRRYIEMTNEEAKERLNTIALSSPFADVKEACYIGYLAIEKCEKHGIDIRKEKKK